MNDFDELNAAYRDYDNYARDAAYCDDYTEHQRLKSMRNSAGAKISKIELRLATEEKFDIIEQVRNFRKKG